MPLIDIEIIYYMHIGEDIAFIYPDLETALVGTFEKGKKLIIELINQDVNH